jgi:nucleoside phosphorylase
MAGYAVLSNDRTMILTSAGYMLIAGEGTSADQMPSPAERSTRRAVILTALAVETRAVLWQLPRWTEEVVRGTVFYRGRFRDWDVAVAEIGAGNNAAAAIAERALYQFNPEVALFVGVAGGVKDAGLGDVVIATKVYGYETGKETEQGFRPRPEVMVSAHGLEQRGRALRQKSDWKARLSPDLAVAEMHIHVGPIAAGDSTTGPSALAAVRNKRMADQKASFGSFTADA